MSKYRPQRGGFTESMALASEIADREELASIVSSQINQKVEVAMIETMAEGEDQRNGWDTHLVMVSGCAVGYLNCRFNDLPTATTKVF